MAREYEVEDTRTGRTIVFEWSEDRDPTDADMEAVFAAAAQQAPSAPPPAAAAPAVVDPRFSGLPGSSQASIAASMTAAPASGKNPEVEAQARAAGEEYLRAKAARPPGTLLTPADFASQKTGIPRFADPVAAPVLDPRFSGLPGQSQAAAAPMQAEAVDGASPVGKVIARPLRELGDIFESFQNVTTVPVVNFLREKDYTTRMGEKVLEQTESLVREGALREAKARAATGATLRPEDREALEADEFMSQVHAAFRALAENPLDETVAALVVDLLENSPTYIATAPVGSSLFRAARSAIKSGENAQRLAAASARLPVLRRAAQGLTEDVTSGVAAGMIQTGGEYTPAQAVQDAVAGGAIQLGRAAFRPKMYSAADVVQEAVKGGVMKVDDAVLAKIKAAQGLNESELAEVIRAVDNADIDARPDLEEALAPILTQEVRDAVAPPPPRETPRETPAPDAPPQDYFEDAAVQWREKKTESPYFKKWFGDSKVVDAEGKPLVVYHGTASDVDAFKPGLSNVIYFTAEPDLANQYTKRLGQREVKDGGNVVPTYLQMSNPKVIKSTPSQENWLETAYFSPERIDELKAQGYDGVINEDASEFIVFSPTQIKSATGNRGTFDPANPSITDAKPMSAESRAPRAASAEQGLFDDVPPPESPRVRPPTAKMEEQRIKLFEKRTGERKRKAVRIADVGDLPEGAKEYTFFGSQAASSLVDNGRVQLYDRDFGSLGLRKADGTPDVAAARKLFGRPVSLLKENKPVKSKLESLAERFNRDRVNPQSEGGVTEYWIPPDDPKWADIEMDAYAGLNADDVAAAIRDRPRGKRAEKLAKMEAYSRSPEGRGEHDYAQAMDALRALEESGQVKLNENGSYTATTKEGADFIGAAVYVDDSGSVIDTETGAVIEPGRSGAGEWNPEDMMGGDLEGPRFPPVPVGAGRAPASVPAAARPAAGGGGAGGAPPRKPPATPRDDGPAGDRPGRGPRGGGRARPEPGTGVEGEKPPFIPGAERDSPGDPSRPRIERDVDELRARDASLGIYDRILDRDTRQKWQSLDKRAKRIAETWTLEDFSRQLDSGPLDEYELDAANARLSYARLKEGEANTEFLKAKIAGNAEAVARTQAALIAAKMETAAFQTMFINAKTQTGRLLAVLRRLKEAIGEKGVNPDDEFLKKAMREMDLTPEQAGEMLDAFKNNPDEFDAVLRGFLKFGSWEKFRYWYKAGLLSAVPTQVRNILGTAAEVPLVPIEAAGAAPFDWVLSKFDGTNMRARYAGEALEQFRGALSAMPEAWKTFVGKQATIAKLQTPAFNPNKRFDHQMSPFKGKVGNLISVPFRELEAFDDLGQALGSGAGMGALIYRKAKQTGVPEAQIRAEMESNPELHADIFRGAKEFGERLTFQEKTEGKLGDLIKLANKAEKQGGIGGLLVLQTVPFKKTPSNIINRLIERSPLGYASAAKQLRAWQKLAREVDSQVKEMRAAGATKADVDAIMQKRMPEILEIRGKAADALSRATLGTATLGAFLAMGNAGMLTGSAPKNEKDRLALEASGWQPYSLTWEGADGTRYYFPINRLGGSFVPLLIAAADFTNNEDKAAANKLWSASVALAKGMTEQPFLQGLKDVADLLDGLTSGQEGPMARWASNALVTSAIPNLVASVGRASDPLKRETRPEQEGFPGFVERTQNVAMSRLPGLSDNLPAKLSPTGEPILKPGATFAERAFSPGAVSRETPDDVAAELSRVEAELPENFKGSALPSIPSRTMTVNNESHDLTSEEYALLAQARREATEEMARQIKNPQWNQLSPQEKAQLSQYVYGTYMSVYRDMVKTMVEMRTAGGQP